MKNLNKKEQLYPSCHDPVFCPHCVEENGGCPMKNMFEEENSKDNNDPALSLQM